METLQPEVLFGDLAVGERRRYYRQENLRWRFASGVVSPHVAELSLKVYVGERLAGEQTFTVTGITQLSVVDTAGNGDGRAQAGEWLGLRLEVEVEEPALLHLVRPSTDLVAVAGELGIWLWEAEGLSAVGFLEAITPHALAFSPDGRLLASGARDGTVRLWSVAQRRELAVWEGEQVAFSPAGGLLALSQGAQVRLVDLERQQEKAVLNSHSGTATALAFSADGQYLAVASRDDTVRVWEAENGVLVQALAPGRYQVNALAFSPQGSLLALATLDFIRLWDAEEAQYTALLAEPGEIQGYCCLAFGADGRSLFSARTEGQVRQWELEEFAGNGLAQNGRIYGLALSPDRRQLAVMLLDSIHFWEVETRRRLGSVPQRRGTALAWSPDRRLLASAKRQWRSASTTCAASGCAPCAWAVELLAAISTLPGQPGGTAGTKGEGRWLPGSIFTDSRPALQYSCTGWWC